MKNSKQKKVKNTVDADNSVVSANIITETSLFGESAEVTTFTDKTKVAHPSDSTEAPDATKETVPSVSDESTPPTEQSESSQTSDTTQPSRTPNISVPTQKPKSTQPSQSTDESAVSVLSESSQASVSQPTSDSSESTESTVTSASAQSPKPTRIGKQQRRLEFAEYKEAFLTPKHIEKRHQIWVSEEAFQKLEYYKRVLGDRETTVTSYGDAIILSHFNDYNGDLEAWRKL